MAKVLSRAPARWLSSVLADFLLISIVFKPRYVAINKLTNCRHQGSLVWSRVTNSNKDSY